MNRVVEHYSRDIQLVEEQAKQGRGKQVTMEVIKELQLQEAAAWLPRSVLEWSLRGRAAPHALRRPALEGQRAQPGWSAQRGVGLRHVHLRVHMRRRAQEVQAEHCKNLLCTPVARHVRRRAVDYSARR